MDFYKSDLGKKVSEKMHLLEAAYQRKVYALIDMGESFDADTLSSIKKRVLEDFWGDDVIIDKGILIQTRIPR